MRSRTMSEPSVCCVPCNLILVYAHTQVWVYGNSFKSSLVAIVVPKAEAIKDWAKANGKTGEQGGVRVWGLWGSHGRGHQGGCKG